MKTAVSIPDKVFESAEKLADHLGQSRSKLYTQALSSYLVRHHGDSTTKKLDEVYGASDSIIDSEIAKLQSLSLPKDRW